MRRSQPVRRRLARLHCLGCRATLREVRACLDDRSRLSGRSTGIRTGLIGRQTIHYPPFTDEAWRPMALCWCGSEKCVRIDAIDDTEPLVGLRFLGVSDCGDVVTLAPVRSLVALEAFYAWGSTRVSDNDLSPLLSLPRLREIRMRDRRTYRPHVADLVSAFSARGSG